MASLVTLQDLIKAKGADVVKAELISLLQSNNFDATDWNSGSQSRTLLEIESMSLAELWSVVSQIAKGMFLDTARDGWLTLLAKSQYGLDRIPAEFTQGIATFSLIPGLGPRTINGGDIIISDGLGHNFITDNSSPVTLNTGSPSATIRILAQTAGSANNVGAGTITVVNQGPADITVTNLGLPLAAVLLITPFSLPINVNTLTLNWSEFVNGVTTLKSITFGANYASIAALATALNANTTFNPNLVATAMGLQLQIATKLTGSNQGFTFFKTGTANLSLGLSLASDTSATGGTSVDLPAIIYGAYLTGPFNVNGLTLKGTVAINGVPQTPFTFTFGGNFATLDDLIVILAQNIPGLVATNDNGRLKLATLLNGPNQVILLSQLGTANPYLGFSNSLDQTANGSSAWITTEGRDIEKDDPLIARCKTEWGILGAGTMDAFNFWARSADPKVQKVVVYSNYLNGTPKAGAVTVYIAGLNSSLDSATVINVYNYILARLPIMSQLYVGSITTVPVYFTGTIVIPPGLDITRVRNEIISNVTLYSQSLAIAETVYKSRIIGEVYKVNEPLLDVQLVEPVGISISVNKNQMAVVQEDPATPLKFIIK